MKLSQLVEDRRTVTIPIGSGELTLGYTPAGVTPRMYAMAEAVQQHPENRGAEVTFLVKLLLDMVTDWDVTDDDDAPLPITEGTLLDMPVPILMKILDAIGADIAVPNASSAPSGSGSSPAGSQDALPSGISSFARVGT